jgi:threonine/homoserine/homoserine lactone efflux protein
MWQDWVITGAQIVFVLALIPSIVHSNNKPPLLTSVPTVLGLISTTIAFVTLSLWGSAFAASTACAH